MAPRSSGSPFASRRPMLDREAAEALLLKHLPLIDRVAAMTCSKYGVWDADAEDFAAWVRMKLVEDDYAVLRRYRGDAELKTYLTSVVVRHFFTYDRERRGRWRSSAEARRLGPPAPEVEKLVYRDGYSLAQAGEKLRTAGQTALSDAELARLLARLPERGPLRPVEREPVAGMDSTAGVSRADEQLLAGEAEARRGRMVAALQEAMQGLETEDRLIVQLHFGDGHTLADVARILGIPQKPLYRRVDRLRTRLRTLLEGAGLSRDEVRGLLDVQDDEP